MRKVNSQFDKLVKRIFRDASQRRRKLRHERELEMETEMAITLERGVKQERRLGRKRVWDLTKTVKQNKQQRAVQERGLTIPSKNLPTRLPACMTRNSNNVN